ncbi:hypothetical protein LOK49_LG09G00885 [Camellia lanceoleosa]|uniref:Uncharacterized protein n=1 Tax=Camellia lanceoleosa TaxID=1840588 RepID=A0ACC0GIB4_9ERIC|nr:hypothetical protein LOK49_LG09G00885 [Camellia lanceoleosa]
MGSKVKSRNLSEEDQQNRAFEDRPQLKSIFRDRLNFDIKILLFLAQLNEVDVRLQDMAKELHVAVATCKLRYKENARFVIQYMELKSMSKNGEKMKSLERVGFDLDGLVHDCLSKEVEFGMENDS